MIQMEQIVILKRTPSRNCIFSFFILQNITWSEQFLVYITRKKRILKNNKVQLYQQQIKESLKLSIPRLQLHHHMRFVPCDLRR